MLRSSFKNVSIRLVYRNYSVSLNKQVFLEHLSGENTGISVIHLSRPESKNAIGQLFLNQLRETINSLSETRVVIIRSDCNGVFCAGADLKERKSMTIDQVKAFVSDLRSTFHSLSNLPIPTISCIDGVAFGGGFELCLATDFRIAGSNAKFSLPETKLAIIPGAGGTQRLSRLIGIQNAKELVFTGRIVSPTEALKLGILTYYSDPPFQKALDLSSLIIKNGPIAIKMAKLAIDKGFSMDMNSGLKVESECYDVVIPTKDRIEGIDAFIQKRSPVYKGQ